DGDDEAPEIELPPVAEWVELVRRTLGCPAAPHQQQLVGRIDDAVNAFGQHCRGTRDGCRDELGDCDPEVRQKRDDQSPRAGGMRAQMWITRPKAASTLSCIISDRVGCGKTVWMKSCSTNSAVFPIV